VLFATVVLASVLPARGVAAEWLSVATFWAIAILFFLYGARLSAASVRHSMMNWKLQGGALVATFVLFPLLAQTVAPLAAGLSASLAIGIPFIGSLPSTVRSSIAFTSISQGNVAARFVRRRSPISLTSSFRRSSSRSC
jgi:sodium/bile acid cotransporter 7